MTTGAPGADGRSENTTILPVPAVWTEVDSVLKVTHWLTEDVPDGDLLRRLRRPAHAGGVAGANAEAVGFTL